MATVFKVNEHVRKSLFEGMQLENDSRSIQFDITPWVEELGEGVVTAVAKRSVDSAPYPVVVTRDGNTVTWKPSRADTGYEGNGEFQLVYTVGEAVAKTCVFPVYVDRSLVGAGDPPDPIPDYIDEMREIAADTIQAAQDAEQSAEDAGEAASEAVQSVADKLDSITETTTAGGFDEEDNLCDGLLLQSGYYSGSTTLVANANFSHLKIDVSDTTKVKIDGTHHTYTTAQFDKLGLFVDTDGNYINTINNIVGSTPSNFPYEVNVPSNAKELWLNTDYKASEYPSSIPGGLYVYPWAEIPTTKVLFNAINKEPVALEDLAAPSKKIKVIAGVIRNSGNGWEYINDAGHEPLNLTNVSVNNNGQIVIDYGFTASKVLSLVATPDETFAGQYTIGGSVGLDNSVFNVFSLPKVYGGLVTIANNAVTVTNSSFTSGSFSTSTGEIRLYHPTLSALSAIEKFNISAECNNTTHRVIIGSQGNDYISLFLVNSSGTVLKDTAGLNINIIATRHINPVFVNANNIVNAGGNFWIYGVMEIE